MKTRARRSPMKLGNILLPLLAMMAAPFNGAPALSAIILDGSYDEGMQGASDGSVLHPYSSLTRAVAAAAPGNTLAILANAYPEPCQLPLTLGKQMTLTAT